MKVSNFIEEAHEIICQSLMSFDLCNSLDWGLAEFPSSHFPIYKMMNEP